MPKNNMFFFDIETGGFSAYQSSILSLSYGQDPQQVKSLYANPVPGTNVSRWSEKNVWEPIKGLNTGRQTEREVLEQFLGKLSSLEPGTEVAGWNIGYSPTKQPRDVRGSGAFDIPFLLTRAEKYGLDQQFRETLKNFKVRDIGREYAVRTALELEQYRDVIDEKFYNQFATFADNVTELQKAGKSVSEIAEMTAHKRVAGWQQQLMVDIVQPELRQKFAGQAHMSSFDVQTGLSLGLHEGPIFANRQAAQEWGQRGRTNMLVSSVKKYKHNIPFARQKFQKALLESGALKSGTGANLGSVTDDFIGNLGEELRAQGIDPDEIMGKGFVEPEPSRAGPKIGQKVSAAKPFSRSTDFGKYFDIGLSHFKKNKFKYGVGAAALGLYALQPGTWFSGKDDEYNVIEGLRHEGMAAQKRKELTDFGSGYRGLAFAFTLPKAIQKAMPTRVGFHGSKGEILRVLGETQRLDPKNKKLSKAVEKFSSDLLEKEGESFIALNPYAAKQYARRNKLKYKDVIHGTLAHEAVHYTSRLAGVRGQMASTYLPSGGKTLLEWGTNYTKQRKAAGLPEISKDVITEEFLAHGIGDYYMHGGKDLTKSSSYSRKLVEEHFKPWVRTVPGADDAWNTIEGLRHEGFASKLRKIFTDFGSGWIRRAISKGIAPEKIIQSAKKIGYKHELVAAESGEIWRKMNKLGEGGFGEATEVRSIAGNRLGVLKEAKAKGEEQFLKTIDDEGKFFAPRALVDAINRGNAGHQTILEPTALAATQSMRKQWSAGQYITSLHLEAANQKLARQQLGSTVPEVYGTTEKGFIQEHAGRALKPEEYKAGGEFLEQQFQKMASSSTGIRHYDPDVSNLAISPEGEMKVIDWGLSGPASTFAGDATEYAAMASIQAQKLKSYTPSIKKSTEDLKAMYAEMADNATSSLQKTSALELTSTKTLEVSQTSTAAHIDMEEIARRQQKIQQGHTKASVDLSRFGKDPGKGHMKKTGKIVQ